MASYDRKKMGYGVLAPHPCQKRVERLRVALRRDGVAGSLGEEPPAAFPCREVGLECVTDLRREPPRDFRARRIPPHVRLGGGDYDPPPREFHTPYPVFLFVFAGRWLFSGMANRKSRESGFRTSIFYRFRS